MCVFFQICCTTVYGATGRHRSVHRCRAFGSSDLCRQGGAHTRAVSLLPEVLSQVPAHCFVFFSFSRIGFYNDIAILVLDKPVRKSKYVIPVCLPRAGRQPPKERLPGRRATVVGWGTTYYGGKESTSQRQAELPIWRNEDCDRSYFQPINENFICAGYSDGGVDACQVSNALRSL